MRSAREERQHSGRRVSRGREHAAPWAAVAAVAAVAPPLRARSRSRRRSSWHGMARRWLAGTEAGSREEGVEVLHALYGA